MSIESYNDPWLSPNRQAAFPARVELTSVELHGRRERMFLVLAAMALLASVAVPLLGANILIDVRYMVSTHVPDMVLPDAELAFGAVLLPVGMLATSFVVELYGHRRAYALAFVGLLTSLCAVGLCYQGAHLIDAGAKAPASAFSLALAAFSASVVIVAVHARMRAYAASGAVWLRKLVAALAAQLVAWSVFSAMLYAYAGEAEIARLLLGGAAYTLAFALVDVIPFVLLAHWLAIHLRVGRFDEPDDDESADPAWLRPLPAAMTVETSASVLLDQRASKRPYSSAEMRFFTEGDEL